MSVSKYTIKSDTVGKEYEGDVCKFKTERGVLCSLSVSSPFICHVMDFLYTRIFSIFYVPIIARKQIN